MVGSGGREHALAAALAQSAAVTVTPGNPGMLATPGVAVSAAHPADVDADLWVIGPEIPLVDGLADRLRAGGRAVFGPGAEGARLEGSKAWMKQLLTQTGVPTACYGAFSDLGDATRFLDQLPGPWVVKTDGLAAGKGVLVTEDRDEAVADVAAKLAGHTFGEAGRRVVIEEGLRGEELSVLAVCDGRRAVPLAAAQDFKRIGDHDQGPNTGGMGAYSPVPLAPAAVVERVMDEAVEPTLAALAAQGIDYRGVLYAGIMLTSDGPKVLEFNARFGDPETQVVLPRWQGDVFDVLDAAARGRLDAVPEPSFGSDAAVCVVLAAPGYPGQPRTGDLVDGLEHARAVPGAQVFAAGVAASRDQPGRLVTAGGRVLDIVGLGADLAEARRRAYQAADAVSWTGLQRRNDIAWRALTQVQRPLTGARPAVAGAQPVRTGALRARAGGDLP